MKNIFHVIAVAFVLLALVTAAFDTGPQTTAPPGDVAAIAHASTAAAAVDVPAFTGATRLERVEIGFNEVTNLRSLNSSNTFTEFSGSPPGVISAGRAFAGFDANNGARARI